MSKVKITIVPYKDTLEDEFKAPSKWFFQSATSDMIFIHCRNRADAIQYVKDEFGGRYNVRCATSDKGNGKESAVGRINSRSRQGSRVVN